MLDEANGWTGTMEVSLGAAPLRGAVWATPRLKARTLVEGPRGYDITFSPARVVLYDDAAPVTLTVTTVGVDADAEFVFDLALDVCDSAFGVFEKSVTVGVRAVDDDSDSSAKRRLRQLRVRIAVGVIVSLAVIALLIGLSALRKRKKGQSVSDTESTQSRSTHSGDGFIRAR